MFSFRVSRLISSLYSQHFGWYLLQVFHVKIRSFWMRSDMFHWYWLAYIYGILQRNGIRIYITRAIMVVEICRWYIHSLASSGRRLNTTGSCEHKPSIQFTMEKEQNKKLSFVDVLITHTEEEFSSSVYWKPTFTRWYLNSHQPSLTWNTWRRS